MPKSVTVHARISEDTKKQATTIARRLGIADAAFYALAIEQAVKRRKPRHRIEGPEVINDAVA